MEKRIENVGAIKSFVLAGAATFTLRNPQTGNRFTFRVRKSEKPGAPLFVSVLTGSDNVSDYEYLGCVFEDGFRVTRKSRISPTAPSARAFAWAWPRIVAEASLGVAEVWHCGRCGKCGRALTVPESIESGLGPVCARGGLDGPAPRARHVAAEPAVVAPVEDDRHLDLDDSSDAEAVEWARLKGEASRLSDERDHAAERAMYELEERAMRARRSTAARALGWGG